MKRKLIKKLSLKKSTLSNMSQRRLTGGGSDACSIAGPVRLCILSLDLGNCTGLLNTDYTVCPSTEFLDCSIQGTCFNC
jgi:hypothetical protein